MGVCGVLFIIFLLCKIFEIAPIATWNWWLVCSPAIVELVLDIIAFAIVAYKANKRKKSNWF